MNEFSEQETHYAPAGKHLLTGAFTYDLPSDRNWPGRLSIIWGVLGSLLALIPVAFPFVLAFAVTSLGCGHHGRHLFNRGRTGESRIISIGIMAGTIALVLGLLDIYLCLGIADLLSREQEMHIRPV